jgi:hypothetical protein
MTLILNGHAKRYNDDTACRLQSNNVTDDISDLSISDICSRVSDRSSGWRQIQSLARAHLEVQRCDDRSRRRYYTGRQTGRSQFLEAFSRSRLLPMTAPRRQTALPTWSLHEGDGLILWTRTSPYRRSASRASCAEVGAHQLLQTPETDGQCLVLAWARACVRPGLHNMHNQHWPPWPATKLHPSSAFDS